jgi:hypothetical protein
MHWRKYRLKIQNKFSVEDFKDLIRVRDTYPSTEAVLGHLVILQNRLLTSFERGGNNKITSEALGILIEIGSLAITASKDYEGYLNKLEDPNDAGLMTTTDMWDSLCQIVEADTRLPIPLMQVITCLSDGTVKVKKK